MQVVYKGQGQPENTGDGGQSRKEIKMSKFMTYLRVYGKEWAGTTELENINEFLVNFLKKLQEARIIKEDIRIGEDFIVDFKID